MSVILAALGLTTPAMIAGLTLLSLPVAAHLLNRRARRRLVFPSIQMLSESSASQAKLFRLRRWLLLLLRCLIVALVVMAFARPLWLGPAASAARRDAAHGVVIVLDASASTAQRHDGISAIQSIKAAADRALGDLMPGADQVNLIIADAAPRPAFASMTTNLAALRAEVTALAPTHERADLAGAIALAGELLAEHDGPRQLVVISDMQASNWRPLVDAAAPPALPRDTRLTIVPAVDRAGSNLGLSQGKLTPRAPVVGSPLTASVTVTNHGAAAQTIGIDLRIDGQVAERRSLQVAAGDRLTVPFGLRFERPGDRRLTFAIADDALGADNRLHLPVTVYQRLPVLVLGDDSPNQPGTASYFVTRGLAPHGNMHDPFDVRHMPPSELTAGELQRAAAVFITYLARVDASMIEALDQYVRSGGGVVMFADADTSADCLRRWDEKADDDVAPWPLVSRRMLDARNNLLYLGQVDWQSNLWSEFGPDEREVWSRIRFWRVWASGQVPEDTQMLARFADGSPAVGRRMVGQGRFVLAGFSPEARASDVGKYGAFVALANRLVDFSRGERAVTRVQYAGRSLALSVAADEAGDNPGALQVIGPDERSVGPLTYSGDHRELTLVVDRAVLPGFYRVTNGERFITTAAVNIDPRESDLAMIDTDVAVGALTGQRFDQARVAALGSDEQLLPLRGEPLWGWMFAAALAVAAVELLLLGFWRR